MKKSRITDNMQAENALRKIGYRYLISAYQFLCQTEIRHKLDLFICVVSYIRSNTFLFRKPNISFIHV